MQLYEFEDLLIRYPVEGRGRGHLKGDRSLSTDTHPQTFRGADLVRPSVIPEKRIKRRGFPEENLVLLRAHPICKSNLVTKKKFKTF